MVMKCFLLSIFLIVATLSVSREQGAPQWFLDRVKPFGVSVQNLGDSIWTTFAAPTGARQSYLNFYAMQCASATVRDVTVDDAFVIVGALTANKTAKGYNCFFLLFNRYGELVYEKDLGPGTCTDLSRSVIECSNADRSFRVIIRRERKQWYCKANWYATSTPPQFK